MLRLRAELERGVKIDADTVPTKLEHPPISDVLFSETPQRMLGLVPAEKLREVDNIFSSYGVPLTVIGKLIDSDLIEYHWHHRLVAEIPYKFAINSFVRQKLEIAQSPPMLPRDDRGLTDAPVASDSQESFGSLEDLWLDLLANPNLSSKKAVYEEFDYGIGMGSLQVPGGDAAVIRLRNIDDTVPQSKVGIAISADANSLYEILDPYLAGVHSVAEGLRNLAAVGARPIGMSQCLTVGSKKSLKTMFSLAETIRGVADASNEWGIPLVSTRVNFSGPGELTGLHAVPGVFLIGRLEDVEKSCSVGFKNSGDRILLLGQTHPGITSSEFFSYNHKEVKGEVPDLDFELEKRTCKLVCGLIERELLNSAHDVSSGGLALCLTECCVQRGRPIGARLIFEEGVFERSIGMDDLLFSESPSRFLLSCSPENEAQVRAMVKESGIPIAASGTVGGKSIALVSNREVSISLKSAARIWASSLDHMFGAYGNPLA